jgi:hypothetical protein
VVSSRSAEPRAAQLSAGRLRLDPDLDFVIHEEGAIELTEAGFRRMLQAHSAGFNAVIGIGSREVLRLPAPKLGHAPSAIVMSRFAQTAADIRQRLLGKGALEVGAHKCQKLNNFGNLPTRRFSGLAKPISDLMQTEFVRRR